MGQWFWNKMWNVLNEKFEVGAEGAAFAINE